MYFLFQGVCSCCPFSSISAGRSYSTVTDLIINDCAFFRFEEFSSHGGVIYATGNCRLNITKTMFVRCMVSGTAWGGAIYFSSSESCYMSSICAFGCSCPNDGIFCYLYAPISKDLDLTYISVTSCSEKRVGLFGLRIDYGNQNIQYLNSTNNRNMNTAGIHFEYPYTLVCSYCSFVDNDSTYINIQFYGTGNSRLFTKCNVVNSTQDDSYGCFYISGSGTYVITYSVIFNNAYYLFYVNSGGLTVSSCCIDHQLSQLSYGSLVTQSLSMFKTQLIDYLFFATFYCEGKANLATSLPHYCFYSSMITIFFIILEQ